MMVFLRHSKSLLKTGSLTRRFISGNIL